jgi:hypothetical protein
MECIYVTFSLRLMFTSDNPFFSGKETRLDITSLITSCAQIQSQNYTSISLDFVRLSQDGALVTKIVETLCCL